MTTLPQAPIAPRLPANVDTPALVVDLDIVERNVQRMGQAAADRGVALRPHIKTHKSVALARIQLAAGALGITVGTLGEAEVMTEGGISDIFLAYPLWASGNKAARLRALHERDGLTFAVGVDSVEGGTVLAAAVAGTPEPLQVVVELDPGYHRTGVDPSVAASLAEQLRALGLDVVGVFTHGGHAYKGREMVDQASADEVRAIEVGRDQLRAAGFDPTVLSAGSTPTALGAARAPVSEVRPGTYVVNDRIQVHMGSCAPTDVAIAVAATVVSRAGPDTFVVDAGAKSLTKDVPPYLDGHGFLPAYPDALIERLSDYHGEVRLHNSDSRSGPNLGDVLAIVPNHACPVIDLFDSFVATRDGDVVGRWRVDARGRS